MRMTRIPVWATASPETTLWVDGADTQVPVWLTSNRRERNKGLLGTDGLDGALWIRGCNSVHCVGMRYPIDVVHLSRRGQVLAVVRMRPGSIGLPRLRGRAVLELPAGQADRLGIRPGATLEARKPAGTPA